MFFHNTVLQEGCIGTMLDPATIIKCQTLFDIIFFIPVSLLAIFIGLGVLSRARVCTFSPTCASYIYINCDMYN